MALRVWLPLNGNFNNQGLSANTSNFSLPANASWEAGKFGNNLVTSNASTTASFSDISGLKTFTISVWWKLTPDKTFTTWADIIHFNTTGGSTGTFRVEVSNTSGTTTNWFGYGMTSGGLCSQVVTPGVWYNDVVTVDNGVLKRYLNGVYKGGVTVTADVAMGNSIKLGDPGVYVSLADVRVYDECLSQKQIKEISKGLIAHYKLDNRYNTENLIINGFGELGNVGWSTPSNISTTEIPSGVAGVKASFYNGNATINDSLYRIPICPTHSYTISAYIKSSGATSGNTYPSIFPYDVDKKFMDYFKCAESFQASTLTTLAQPLNPGDTVIYATDLSQWSTATNNYWYHVAIFGYADSTGYVYPDMEYTQDSPSFGTYSDKSNINKTNNTITLKAPFAGEARPAGTKIVQATEGSTYYYPFGGLPLSSLTDWTFKTATFVPYEISRLRYSKYWTYSTYQNSYHAAIKLIDNTWSSSSITDVSGNGYNLFKAGALAFNSDSARYGGSTAFDGINTNYLYRPKFDWLKAPFTFNCWCNQVSRTAQQSTGTTTLQFVESQGRDCGYGGFSLCISNGTPRLYLGTATSGTFYSINSDTAIALNTWHMLTGTYDGTTAKLYVDGVLKGSQNSSAEVLWNEATGFTIGKMAYTYTNTVNYFPFNGSISDVRVYATALSADDIKELYQTSALIDNQGNAYAYEFKEE